MNFIAQRDGLKYEFHVHPGADYQQIQVSFAGAGRLWLDDEGSLHVDTGQGEMIERAPYIYQQIGVQRVAVSGAFRLTGSTSYAFELTGDYDARHALIIDPNLQWSSYLGGAGLDTGESVAADSQGTVWVTGGSASAGWVSGGGDTTFGGQGDAFVSRFAASGALLWSTYLGASDADWAWGIDVDESSRTGWVTGLTRSVGWVSGNLDNRHDGLSDAFVAQIDDQGQLLWSTYLGGDGNDVGLAVAVQDGNRVMVTGTTYSDGWLGSQSSYSGDGDAFVAQITPRQGRFTGAYLGGSGPDEGRSVAVDSEGYAWVTGTTNSADLAFATHRSAYGGAGDAFVARLKPFNLIRPPATAWKWLGWSQYLGGTEQDNGYGVAVDGAGKGWVTGFTASGGFASEDTYHGAGDAFVAQLESNGDWRWGTHLGGAGRDEGRAITVDALGVAWVAGSTASSGWASGGFDTSFNGSTDAFVARIDAVGQTRWSSYVGGAQDDAAYGIAMAGTGQLATAWLTGSTSSPDWVWGAGDVTYDGAGDVWVAKIDELAVSTLLDLRISNDDLTLTPAGTQVRVTATVHNATSSPLVNVPVRFRDKISGLVVGDRLIPELAGFDSAEVSVLWSPAGLGSLIEVIADPFNLIHEVSHEDDNIGIAVWGGVSPAVLNVSATSDGNSDPQTFGRFVSGVRLYNTFYASVADPDGAANLDFVRFSLGPLGSQDAYRHPDFGYAASFDMGLLTRDTTLQVIAYDKQGHASTPWSATVHVVPFPAWLGSPGDDDYFDLDLETHISAYHLTGFFPESMQQSFTMPEELLGIPIPIIGGTDSGFRFGIESTVIAPLSTSQTPETEVAAVGYVEIFDNEVLNERIRPEYNSEYLDVTSLVTVDPQTLDLQNLLVSVVLTEFPLFDFETPEYTLLTLGIPFLVDVSARASMGIWATLDARLTLLSSLESVDIEVLEASLEPDIGGWGKLIGAARLVGFDLARLEGGAELVLRPSLAYNLGDWEAGLDGTFRIPWRVTLGWCPICLEWNGVIPNEDGWQFSLDDGLSAASDPVETPRDELRTATLFPMLSSDQDAAGNSLVVRTQDVDPAIDRVNSDIYYSYRPVHGEWTELAPLAASPEMLTQPVVALDGHGGAVAVWVANSLSAIDDQTTPSDFFRHQDLYADYFDGTAWRGEPVRITKDAFADGQPTLATDPITGNAILLWTRSVHADASDRSAFEIAYATWDRSSHKWSAVDVLTQDATADWSPQVAFNQNSQAMAIWSRQASGDPAATELAYAVWDEGWSDLKTADYWSRATGMAIASVPGGEFLVAAVDQLFDDTLRTAVFDPTLDRWDTAKVAAPRGIIQEPRLGVNREGVATLLWHGVTDDGQNDLWIAARQPGAAAWTAPHRLTNDADIQWMSTLLFDDDNDPYSAHELIDVDGESQPRPRAAELPDLGADVGVVSVNLAADLAVDQIKVVATAGAKSARIAIDVMNRGLMPSAATVATFYRGDPDAGGTPIGAPVTVSGLVPGEFTHAASIVFVPESQATEYYVVLTPVAGESVVDNNVLRTPIDPQSFDSVGPQASLRLAMPDLVTTLAGELTIDFNEPIAHLVETDFMVVESGRGFRPPDDVDLSPDLRSVTLRFTGGLPRGNYTLTVYDQVTDAAGNGLDGDTDGVPGGDYHQTFHVFPGDFNADGDLTAIDINLLSAAMRQASHSPRFDVNSDGFVDADDHRLWVEMLKWTYYGDANLDGVFDTLDLVTVFIINEYEDNVPGNSTWEDGDWDGDGEFETGDLIVAFQAGGYEQGIRPAAAGQPSTQGAARPPVLSLIAGHTEGALRRRPWAP